MKTNVPVLSRSGSTTVQWTCKKPTAKVQQAPTLPDNDESSNGALNKRQPLADIDTDGNEDITLLPIGSNIAME